MKRTPIVALIVLWGLSFLALTGGNFTLQTSRPGNSLEAGPTSTVSPDDFLPMLQRASEQADRLVTLGDTRERNLFRIRAEQGAMLAALDDADAWLDSSLPNQDVPAFAAYRDGATTIRGAMNEAQAGFLRFDFDRVARANETLQDGAASLHRALDLLADA